MSKADDFKYTTISLKSWTKHFILRNPWFSLKAFWSDLEEGS